MVICPQIQELTQADFDAIKHTLSNFQLTFISDNTDAPLAIGSQQLVSTSA